MRRCLRRLGSTNRYTDGSGRALDSSDLPTSLDLQPISNRAYPVQGEHWLPVIAGKPSPQKGNVIISGAGVVGLSIGTQFALRGWHTTIVERASRRLDSQRRPASEMMLHDARASAITVDPLRPFDALEYALVNRRAANALEAAGLRVGAFRDYGVPVSGVMDHPGAYNSWLTKGLVEHHSFATKVLSMDLWLLRQHMTRHAEGLTQGSLEVFYDHTVEAVYPLKQQAVVKPWEGSVAQKEWRQANSIVAGTTGEAEDMVLKLKQEQVRRKKNTSLSISPLKWAKQFVKDAVDYDLLIGAEGINSRMRDAFDIEGFAADIDFGVKWFLLESSSLSAAHIHRWLHRRQHAPVKSAESYHIQSPYQVPMCVAFPRVENAESSQSPSPSSSPRHFFSVMAYMPMHELMALSDEEMLHRFLRDVVQVDPQAKLKSFTRITQPSPTIYCENLHNTVGLPSAVMVGDAAHYCHPFWMQGLAMGLEDGLNLLNQVDSFSRHFFEAVKQYSDERGVSGDAMRELTDNCLYYQRKKHRNPLIRFRNSYQQWMNLVTPKRINDMYEGSVNHVYSRSIEDMLNGRGYTSYDYAEKQQAKHRSFYHIGRLYT